MIIVSIHKVFEPLVPAGVIYSLVYTFYENDTTGTVQGFCTIHFLYIFFMQGEEYRFVTPH